MKQIKNNTLYAYRERKTHLNQITTIKDCNGFIKIVLTGYQQPKKSKNATITLRGKTYNLNFIN